MQRQTGVDKLLLIADTNRGSSIPSEWIMRGLYRDAKSIVSTTLHDTCCYPRYAFKFDRIIAAEFPGAASPMRTSLPFKGQRPRWSVTNMHYPLRGYLTYYCSRTPAAGARQYL